MIDVIYKTAFEKYLDYEYLISILKDNYNKLIFLGNKRNYNSDKLENQNDEIKKFKEMKFDTDNTNNMINQNNDIVLNEEEELGDVKKVIRYKKTVYVNKITIKEKINNKIRKKREVHYKRISKYRGVSQNGAGWQTLMMFKKNKPYIGTYNSEELAARIYDIASIKKNGIKSKTNYLYTSEQIDRILKTDIDFKDQNISIIISELIK